MIKKTVEGPAANQDDWHKDVEINLAKIKKTVKATKKKHGVIKDVSPEDMWQMQGVQPACHSKGLTNDYYLCCEAQYSGMVCYVNLPDARMPFTIVPTVNPASFGHSIPDGFSP